MDAVKKTHEVQMQVRHNAEEMRNTLNDLYSWEQEMKAKEKELHTRPVAREQKEQEAVPIRSHIGGKNNVEQHQQQMRSTVANSDEKAPAVSTPATTPTEKIEKPPDANEEKRKQSNEYKDKGNKLVKLGKYVEAIYEYTLAIDTFPEDPIFYSNRALCQLKLEKYNECIEDCERAIEIDNLTVKAYYRRMQANECLGNNMDALKDCTTVLMIEPKNAEAKKSLERINDRLRKNVKLANGPNFSPASENLIDILPIEKPPYKRSQKPLYRVPIVDVVGPKDTKNCENYSLKISDDDIDKLFNSNCGPFVEVKQPKKRAAEQPKDLTKDAKITQSKNKCHKSKDKLQATAATTTTATTTTKTNKVSNTTAGTDVLLLNVKRSLPPPPTSTAQFYANWKELAPAQKYQYLKSIDVKHLCKILGAGFDADTLTDLLHVLHDFYLPNKDINIQSTLLEISKNNQMSILSLLMSAEERGIVTEIVNYLKEIKTHESVVEQISKNFKLS